MEQRCAETAHARTRAPWIARAGRAVAETAGAVRAGLSRAAMNRRVLHRLSSLSVRELQDIGLTPPDVADAAVPGCGDATDLLIGRRDGRRRARAAARWR